MSNAGYGNHDEASPVETERPEPKAAETGPGKASARSREPDGTPREGAGPKGPQGADVDPGVG